MATQTYTGLSAQQRTFYDRTLLSRLLPKLVFLQYGQKKPMPKKKGDTAQFRRYNSLAAATTPLTEGVTPAGKSLSITTITATVDQFGDFIELSDLLDLMGIDDNATEALELLGEQAGLTMDTVVRDIVAAGTNVYYVGAATSRITVAAAHKIDGVTMRRVRQIMARNNISPVAGNDYLAFIHPDVAYDIMGDSAWVDANKYAGSTKIFEGEIGKMYGVRYIETTLAPIFTGAGAAGIDVYGTIVIGKDAYGVPDIAGSSKPQTIIKQLGSEGSADPLDQRSSVGWKALFTAVRLQELAILRVESSASIPDA